MGMTIDERIEALTMNLEVVSPGIQDLKVAAQVMAKTSAHSHGSQKFMSAASPIWQAKSS